MVTLSAVVALVVIGLACFRLGVLTQRRDDSDARVRLAASLDSARSAHATEVATLNVNVSRFSTLATLAEARATAADDW